MATTETSFGDSSSVERAIGEHLASAPLYSQLAYSDVSNTKSFPETIVLYCAKCDKDTNWETLVWPNMDQRTGFSSKEYACRNCKAGKITYHFYWCRQNDGRMLFFKIGQWPALEERLPNELKKNLDRNSLNLYHRALTCRNQNLGLGSLVYLRRVIEDKINSILDLIADEAKQVGFEPEQVSKLTEVKEKGLFKDKIDLASAILPPSLRPGGHNPIDALHDLASGGIHRMTEVECVEVFDRVRFVFEYLFREIDMRRRSAVEYADSVAKIATSKKGAQRV